MSSLSFDPAAARRHVFGTDGGTHSRLLSSVRSRHLAAVHDRTVHGDERLACLRRCCRRRARSCRRSSSSLRCRWPRPFPSFRPRRGIGRPSRSPASGRQTADWLSRPKPSPSETRGSGAIRQGHFTVGDLEKRVRDRCRSRAGPARADDPGVTFDGRKARSDLPAIDDAFVGQGEFSITSVAEALSAGQHEWGYRSWPLRSLGVRQRAVARGIRRGRVDDDVRRLRQARHRQGEAESADDAVATTAPKRDECASRHDGFSSASTSLRSATGAAVLGLSARRAAPLRRAHLVASGSHRRCTPRTPTKRRRPVNDGETPASEETGGDAQVARIGSNSAVGESGSAV